MTEAYDNLTLEWLADCLRKYENKPTATFEHGLVAAVNDDGSYQVRLNRSGVTTRCAPFCDAAEDDVVLVVILTDGRCDALATLRR